MKRFDRSLERGFTLVELMIVVAIIAVIATIVIPNYIHARSQAAASASIANMRQIATALELYFADNQCYPGSSIAGCAGSGSSENAEVTPALFGGTGNEYLNVTPRNDVGRVPYKYSLVAGTAGSEESYRIDDPSRYAASVLNGQVDGNGSQCAGTCSLLHYSPTLGVYATAE